tara:strand:- start:1150 stop:1332 length:183 start_codon:yes stop_codon:yes gene_type:complete
VVRQRNLVVAKNGPCPRCQLFNSELFIRNTKDKLSIPYIRNECHDLPVGVCKYGFEGIIS